MPTRSIANEHERDLLLRWLDNMPLPFTVSVAKGRRRSTEANRLQRLWLNEIAEQKGDMTAEEIRAYCKLTIGVPILRAENEVFAEKYDAVVKPMSYETKLAIMAEPLDMPITRLMTTGQHARYLDEVYKHWTAQGMSLTEPERENAV